MAKGQMTIDVDGLRLNIARNTNEIGRLINELENCIIKNQLKDIYYSLACEVWTLTAMSGTLDKPLKSLSIDIYKLK